MSKAFDFAKEFVHRHPQASFKDVKMAGRRKKLKVLPIQFGKVLQMVRQTARAQPKRPNGLNGAAHKPSQALSRQIEMPLEILSPTELSEAQVDSTALQGDVFAQAVTSMRDIEKAMKSIGFDVVCEIRHR